VLDHFAAEPSGDGGRGLRRIALDGKIQVDGFRTAEPVAHHAADQVGGRQTLERRQQRANHHSRTGMPAARIASLASRTVYSP
jgi:hypothetical protein